MHRHGIQARKLSRKTDQRRALIGGLANSLILYESIVTTEAKAKTVIPFVEGLITKAKKGGLHNHRQIFAALPTQNAAKKLVMETVSFFKDRNGGYTTTARIGNRSGDNAPMVKVSLVGIKSKPEPEEAKAGSKAKLEDKKTEEKHDSVTEHVADTKVGKELAPAAAPKRRTGAK